MKVVVTSFHSNQRIINGALGEYSQTLEDKVDRVQDNVKDVQETVLEISDKIFDLSDDLVTRFSHDSKMFAAFYGMMSELCVKNDVAVIPLPDNEPPPFKSSQLR